MKYLLFFGLFIILACSNVLSKTETAPVLSIQEKRVYNFGSVYADNKFNGARLNDFIKINDTSYQAVITPENTPVNSSPWYGFRVWSEKETRITLEIVYTGEYKHRFIPKLSKDGVSWEPLNENDFNVNSSEGTVKLELNLTPSKLWVSAQENINSDQIYSWVDSLATIDFIDKEIIGESVLGKPLPLLKINNGKPKHSIVLIGRQHPPEVPGGTISLMTFVHSFLSQSILATSFRDRFEIIVIPLLNPDGVDAGNWRHNANGKDLNRDWISFSQPETKAVRKWMYHSTDGEKERSYCFGLDFHTSYSGPYLLTLDTIPHKVLPTITLQWIKNIEYLTSDTLDIRPRAQSLPYCYNWFINEVGIEAVTFEEGDEINRSEVKLRAKNYANTLMETLLAEYY